MMAKKDGPNTPAQKRLADATAPIYELLRQLARYASSEPPAGWGEEDDPELDAFLEEIEESYIPFLKDFIERAKQEPPEELSKIRKSLLQMYSGLEETKSLLRVMLKEDEHRRAWYAFRASEPESAENLIKQFQLSKPKAQPGRGGRPRRVEDEHKRRRIAQSYRKWAAKGRGRGKRYAWLVGEDPTTLRRWAGEFGL